MNVKKTVALLGAGLAIVATTISSTFAAAGDHLYTLSGTGVAYIGFAASDTATSLFGTMAQLLPVMIPIIVIGVVIGFVRGMFHKRG